MSRPHEFEMNYGHQLAQGLQAFYGGRHPGSTYYHDSSLYGRHGTLTAMEPETDWVVEPEFGCYSLALGGTDEFVDMVGYSPLVGGATQATLSFWAYRASTSHLVVLGNYVYASRFNVLWNSDGRVYNQIIGDYPNYALGGTGWHHLAMVFDGGAATKVLGYVDGMPMSMSNPASQTSIPTGGLFRIGNETAGGGRYATGKVHSVAVHSRCLADSEIRTLASRDPYLGGLILLSRRLVRVRVPAGAPAALKPAWAQRRNTLIGGGV